MTNSYWRGKKVVVTGASGFIGSHFVEELSVIGANIIAIYQKENENIKYLKILRHGRNIIYLKLNLLHRTSVHSALRGVNVVINCAAIDGNAEYKRLHSSEIVDKNTNIVLNLLDASVKNNVSDILLMSSTDVYPEIKKNTPGRQDDFYANFDRALDGYVVSKRFTEIVAKIFSNQHNIRVFTPRPTNTYGPRDKFGTNHRIIPSIINRILNNETIEVWGDGKQAKPYIYVKDMVKGCLEVVRLGINSPINIASSKRVSINKLIKIVAKLTGNKPKVKYTNSNFFYQNQSIDTTDLSSLIKFNLMDVECGLKETIEWYKSSYK